MLDQHADLAGGQLSGTHAAETLFADGMPISLTPQSARAYAARCDSVLAALTPRHGFRALATLVAKTIATSHFDARQSTELSADAQQLAERLGGEVARAYALLAWGFAHQGPEHAERRVSAGYEILETASTHNEPLLGPAAGLLLLVALLEQGEIRSLDAELLNQRFDASAPSARSRPDITRWFDCLRSILDGDTSRAERQAEAMFAGSTHEGTDAFALYTTQIGMIRWMQGRVDGTEEGFLAARREYPEQLLWPASLGWLWLLQGRRGAAEALLRSLPDLDEIPRDRYWLSTLTVLAEAARLTDDREQAQRLRELLLPFAHHPVAVGVGVAFWGTAARTLGLLEEHLGLHDDARRHLELAVTICERLGAMAWHAEALIELAEFALRHELDDVPAYALLDEARATSEARGFVALTRRAMHRPRICVLGRFEVISLCGVRAEWNSRKARDLAKMLIAARGVATSREVFMEAMWPGVSPAKLGNRFSVAVNVVRRALDPKRLLPTQHHVVTEGDSIRLDIDNLDIDLERFLCLAASNSPEHREAALRLYRGDPFSDEPYSDWAANARSHARVVRDALG